MRGLHSTEDDTLRCSVFNYAGFFVGFLVGTLTGFFVGLAVVGFSVVGFSVVGELVGAGVVGPVLPPPHAQHAVLAVNPAWANELPYWAQFVPSAYHRQLYLTPSLSYHPPLSVQPG